MAKAKTTRKWVAGNYTCVSEGIFTGSFQSFYQGILISELPAGFIR